MDSTYQDPKKPPNQGPQEPGPGPPQPGPPGPRGPIPPTQKQLVNTDYSFTRTQPGRNTRVDAPVGDEEEFIDVG